MTSTDDNKKLRTFGVAILCFSLFFWAWAVWNTITKQFDLGVVSFLLAAAASLYLVLTKTIPSPTGQWLIVTCYLIVVANYILGAVLGFTMLSQQGFAIYCIVFSILWIGIACTAFRMMSSSRKATSGSDHGQASHLKNDAAALP